MVRSALYRTSSLVPSTLLLNTITDILPLPLSPLPSYTNSIITQYSTEGKIKEPNLAAEAGQGLLTAVTSYARGDMGGVFSSLTKIAKTATGGGGKAAEERSRRTKTSSADVVSFAALWIGGWGLGVDDGGG